ncbi:MFS transporter [Sporolactobacillus sp. THM19-2]|uniref:MFS transporter n=1 Tax=Sporolactobacillus sp. THM19-2 TaxID=2511171 RepID=UPI00101FC53D|nr:MFS transporter [Sporolactobacillus sp. THM19-2]RYL86844.1 MFS transporter [Sporolactobacillus sp. THM19-2]
MADVPAPIKKTYPEIFKPVMVSRSFRFLWIGNSLSTFGTAITNVILPLLVYELSHSPMSMSLIMAAYMIPEVLILPFSGILVDRLNRANVMRTADIIRFVLTTGVMILGLYGALSIPLLVVMMGFMGLMNGLFQPAYSALRATVFVPDIRNSANALSQFSEQLLRLLGPSVGGLIISFTTASLGFGIDGLTYLISFICLMFLTQEGMVSKRSRRTTSFFSECFEGVRVIRQRTWLWVTILFFSLVNIFISGVATVLIPWLIKVHDQLPDFVYGFVMSGAALGSITVAFVFGMRKKWRYRGILAYSGGATASLALLVMPFAQHAVLLTILMALTGGGLMLFSLIWQTSLQELVPPEAFGRVASIDMVGSFALLPVGFLLTGWLSEAIGGVESLLLMSGIAALSNILILLVPAIRKFD